ADERAAAALAARRRRLLLGDLRGAGGDAGGAFPHRRQDQPHVLRIVHPVARGGVPRPDDGRARARGGAVPDDGARSLPERGGARAQEVSPPRLCLPAVPRRADRGRGRLRRDLFYLTAGAAPARFTSASPAPGTSARSPPAPPASR